MQRLVATHCGAPESCGPPEAKVRSKASYRQARTATSHTFFYVGNMHRSSSSFIHLCDRHILDKQCDVPQSNKQNDTHEKAGGSLPPAFSCQLLYLEKGVVMPLPFHKLFMRSHFNNSSMLNQYNPVGMCNR